jgi:hypothetical protein
MILIGAIFFALVALVILATMFTMGFDCEGVLLTLLMAITSSIMFWQAFIH